MKKRDKYYIIETVKAARNKEERIKSRLTPLFENGVVWLKRGMRELEEELSLFPRGKFDDLIDALAWQVKGKTATEYEKVPERKRALPGKDDRMVFTLDEIRNSCRKRSRAPYPFQVQMGTHIADMG